MKSKEELLKKYEEKFLISDIEKQIENGNCLSDAQFELCTDPMKLKYYEKRTEAGNCLSDAQFEFCTDPMKLKYCEKRIENGNELSIINIKWLKK